jgi:ParB family transcriptional regulator, chromosome partitioning protein
MSARKSKALSGRRGGAGGMSRKGLFGNLGSAPSQPGTPNQSGEISETPSSDAPPQSRHRMRPILGSPDLISDPAASPIGAIGQSLNEFSERAKRAEAIERKLTEGQVIVDLDPTLIDPSFVADRMPASREALASLTEKIRDHGQLNPILVRPHPDAKGRFQVAFGHRRLRVTADLGRPVKAVVRDLSDEELVIAQGQENHERQDLSYIEKARFAQRLEKQFSRVTIMASMSIYKSDLSNMLSVVSKIPEEVIDAIGPAPGIGRRGWIDLAAQLASSKEIAAIKRFSVDPTLRGLESDERFKRVLACAKPRPTLVRNETWSTERGEPLATVALSENRISLTIDRKKSPEFSDFVLNRLRELYIEFEASSSEGSRLA